MCGGMFFFQAEDGIRDLVRSRGLGDVYKRQVLQSPFNNLDTYLSRYSYKKWGNMKYLWYPIFRKKVEKLLEYPVSDLDLTKIAAFNELPILFITASDDDEVFTSETLQIFLASASQKKDLFLVKKADHNLSLIHISEPTRPY